MRCSGHKIVLLLYILEFASGFSQMPHVQKTIVLRCSGPFMNAPKGDDQDHHPRKVMIKISATHVAEVRERKHDSYRSKGVTDRKVRKGDNREKKDWITFLTRAHEMTEEDVAAQIKTPAVLRAFELAKLSTLPDDVRAAYEAEVREHDRYALHTAELIRMSKIEVARKLLAMNLTVDQIEKATGLSSEDIKSIK
jgi:hypothetical protein